MKNTCTSEQYCTVYSMHQIMRDAFLLVVFIIKRMHHDSTVPEI